MSVEELADLALIGIWDSGPLGELVWERIISSDMTVKSSIQVDTYYIAASLVAQGLGCCTIDKFTALATLSPKVSFASFEPPLPFQLKGLYLHSKPLSRICEEFTEFVKNEVEQTQALTAITPRYGLHK